MDQATAERRDSGGQTEEVWGAFERQSVSEPLWPIFYAPTYPLARAFTAMPAERR